jgi:hypothetical protein
MMRARLFSLYQKELRRIAVKKAVNNLNSVLIEGTVSGNLNIIKTGKEICCSFVVSSLQYFSGGKRIKERETRVWVMLRNTKLVKVAAVKIRDGRGVRIVGRLAADEGDNALCVEAEHLEYRPEPEDED